MLIPAPVREIAHRRADELREDAALDPDKQVAANELVNVPTAPVQQISAEEFLNDARQALTDAKQFAASGRLGTDAAVESDAAATRHASEFVDALFQGNESGARDALVSALESVTPKLPDAETQRGTIQAVG